MTKLEFLKELESLLPDIPLEEREEAIQYYNGYFEDAGEDNEEVIMKELGSPSKVAAIIKADLNSNATDRESRGYFTEKGYQDTIYHEEKFEIIGPENKGTTDNEEFALGIKLIALRTLMEVIHQSLAMMQMVVIIQIVVIIQMEARIQIEPMIRIIPVTPMVHNILIRIRSKEKVIPTQHYIW